MLDSQFLTATAGNYQRLVVGALLTRAPEEEAIAQSWAVALSEWYDQRWFWTEEWQAGELQADEDIRLGRFIRFENDEDFLASLD